MKKLITLFIVLIVAWGCKCPTCPDLAEVIEEVEKPTAQVLLIMGVSSYHYSSLHTQIALREVKGVEARVTNVSIRVSFDMWCDEPDVYRSYLDGDSGVDIGTGIVPANGSLPVYFVVPLPIYAEARTALIKVYLTDVNGHELEVLWDIILLG